MKTSSFKTWRALVMLAFIIQCPISSIASEPVRLTINDGAPNQRLKTKVEGAVSTLLTDINNSFAEDLVVPQLTGDMLLPEAKQDFIKLWSNEHFRCTDEEVVERLLTTREGYQVRGIPLSVKQPGNSSLVYQEAVINLDKNGFITSFFYAINSELYSAAMKEVMQNRRNEVTVIEERMMILNYVEHFRTAYNQKDIHFLRQVFSNDALIITGRVIKVANSELFPNGKRIIYNQQNKEQYLSNLERAFRANSYIKVTFDDVFITAHPTIDGIYGVTVHQNWRSSSYSDEGYVFMVWDFRNPDEPQIHVRTWQPEFIDKIHGQRLNRDDVFQLGDFDLIK